MNKPLKYFAIALGVAAAVAALLYFNKQDAVAPEPSTTVSPRASGRVCTLEAKLCPDGSYVGRTGPNCEFTPCP